MDIYGYIYIYGYQVPDTKSCQVPDRARYSARHNYTGGGPNVRKKLGHPLGQPNMRWSNSDAWKW